MTVNVFQDGFALEAAANLMLAKGMFEMQKSSDEMDYHGGTDYVVLCEDYKVAVGLTLRDDISKFVRDGEKFAYYIKSHSLCKLYAPLHIEVVIVEQDPLDWEAALMRGLMEADSIACDWDNQENVKDWFTWRGMFRQVVITANKKGVRNTIRDFRLD